MSQSRQDSAFISFCSIAYISGKQKIQEENRMKRNYCYIEDMKEEYPELYRMAMESEDDFRDTGFGEYGVAVYPSIMDYMKMRAEVRRKVVMKAWEDEFGDAAVPRIAETEAIMDRCCDSFMEKFMNTKAKSGHWIEGDGDEDGSVSVMFTDGSAVVSVSICADGYGYIEELNYGALYEAFGRNGDSIV
jgi:hypothetical protein